MATGRGEYLCPGDFETVKLSTMGHVTELFYSSFANKQVRIKKLDADHYILVDSDGNEVGEVQEFNHYESRADSVCNLRATFKRLRALINSNVLDIDSVRFVTLTYAQPDGKPMRDVKRLLKDYEHFWKRFVRWCKVSGWEKPEYISVVEPQGSGSWHCHVLLFWPPGLSAPFLPNDRIRALWGQGFVSIKALRDHLGRACDNVGAYLTAYLGDLPIGEALESKIDVTKFEFKVDGETSKRYLKGARLWLYPPGMNIYRCSRGVRRPVDEEVTWKEAKEKVRGATLTYQRVSSVACAGTDAKNTVYRAYYNESVDSCQDVIDGIRVDLETGEVLQILDRTLYPDDGTADAARDLVHRNGHCEPLGQIDLENPWLSDEERADLLEQLETANKKARFVDLEVREWYNDRRYMGGKRSQGTLLPQKYQRFVEGRGAGRTGFGQQNKNFVDLRGGFPPGETAESGGACLTARTSYGLSNRRAAGAARFSKLSREYTEPLQTHSR